MPTDLSQEVQIIEDHDPKVVPSPDVHLYPFFLFLHTNISLGLLMIRKWQMCIQGSKIIETLLQHGKYCQPLQR